MSHSDSVSGVQLTVSSGRRIALSGDNGSGKSTSMKIAAGIIEYDTGRIIRPGDTRTAYLPQSGLVHRGRRKQRRSALKSLKNQEERLTLRIEENEAASIRGRLEEPENYSDADKAHALPARLVEAEERIERITRAWEETAAALEKAEEAERGG